MDIEEAKEKLKYRLEPKKYGGKCALGYSKTYCFGTYELEAIETVLSELEKKDKIINLMAKYMAGENSFMYATEKQVIKYFANEVEKEGV